MSRKTRKLIWSAPLMAALVVAGALAMFVVLVPDGAQATHEEIPDAPTNVLARPADGNAGRTAMVVSWTAPAGSVTGYRIDYSTDNIQWMQLEESYAGSPYQHTGLDPGKQYIYRVFALNSAGPGLVSETYSSVTKGAANQPDNVTGLTASIPSSAPEKWHQIDLRWTEPSGGERKIAGYCIEVVDDNTAFPIATQGCRDTTLTAVPLASNTAGVILPGNTKTTYSDKNLDPEDRRYYRVFAITNTSATVTAVSEMPSNTAIARTAAAENPYLPGTLRAAKNGVGDSVNLYWYWPTSDGGVDISNFRVEVTTNPSSWPRASEDSSSNPFVGVDVTATGDAANDNGVLMPVNAATARSGTDPHQGMHAHGVTVEKKLYYRVFTQTGTGAGVRSSTRSNMASVVVRGGLNPTTPNFLAPENAVKMGRTQIDLTWAANDYNHDNDGSTAGIPYPASGYRIDYAEDVGSGGTTLLQWMPLWGNTGFTEEEFSHINLKPSTTAYYRIFAIGPNQSISTAAGIRSATTDPPGALGKARNLMVVANDPTKITLTWDHPEGLSASDVDYYAIQMKMQGATDPNQDAGNRKTTDGPVTTYMDTDLTQNQTWLYRVAAVSPNRDLSAGASPLMADEYTDWAVAVTPAGGKPEAPVGLVAEDARNSNGTAPGQRGVLLVWNVPEGPVGSEVTSYKIERMVEGADSNFKALSTSDKRTSVTDFEKPEVDEVRHYRVAAVANNVTGEWARVRFPMDLVHNFAPTAVGTIAAQTVTAGQSVTVDVTANFSDADVGDTLTYRATSDMTMYATAEVDDMGMVTITGVAAGMATITVTATDMAGETAKQEIMVTVEAADMTPTSPSNVMVTADDTNPGDLMITVAWQDGENVEAHGVVLFTSDFSEWPYIARGMNGSHTFSVDAGSYVAVVVALNADGTLLTDANGAYLFGPANAVTIGQ